MASRQVAFCDWRAGVLATLCAAMLLPAVWRPASGAQETSVPSSPPPPAGAATESPSAPGIEVARNREAIFDAFYSTDLDTTVAYPVVDLRISKDTVSIILKQGVVFLQKPIAGEITGAAFLGEGEITTMPPNRTERYMLKRQTGTEVLKEPFTSAVFRYTDGTERGILAPGNRQTPAPEQVRRAVEIFAERNSLLDRERWIFLEAHFLENRISGLRGQDPFVADLLSAKHGWITYLHNPMSVREHYLTTSASMGAKEKRYLIPWMAWHKSADYSASGHYQVHPERDGARLLRIRHSEMKLDFTTTKSVEYTARLRIEPTKDDLYALHFSLDNNADYPSRWFETQFYPVRMVRVTDEAGRELPFLHRRDRLLVLLDRPTRAGTSFTLAFEGKADVVDQLTAESFGLFQNDWYPKYSFRDRFSFDWTVRVPQPFLISGSGNRVREFEDKSARMNGLQMRSDTPVGFAWLIFGRFLKSESVYTSAVTGKSVRMTIHSFPNMTSTITDPYLLDLFGLRTPIQVVLTAPMKKIEGFFDESKEILKLLETLYGPYPFDELHIAQMAPQLGFGQAPAGFVQLTGAAFMSQAKTTSDFIHGFLSHEIAHQWWGHKVGWASSDDQWLSEAFAEYAAGIFVKEYQGAKRFQQQLGEWRRDAKYSDAEAPIAAANDIGGLDAGRHRRHLLYAKGPYILHMLRLQLGDEKYMEVMRAINETYSYQNISTEMLLREVNRVTKSDFTSFFDQWYWDVGIPTFKYRWRSEKQPDGKFLITVNVSQEDRANVKKVLMPIYIHFKDKSIPQYRPVLQADQEIKIMSPAEPKNVTLDDERTLLAEFVKQS